jgi:hypothetical protein
MKTALPSDESTALLPRAPGSSAANDATTFPLASSMRCTP